MLKRSLIFFLLPLLFFAQTHNFENQVRLAKSFEARGQLDLAEEIYTELYKNFSGSYQFYSYLLNNLISQKKYDQALALIDQQIGLNNRSVNLYGDKGNVLFLMGNEEDALQIWEDALDIEAGNAFAYRTIADYLIQNRLIDMAIEVLKRGNSVSKDPTVFSYDIANFYSITMKFDKAAEEYCRILESKPKQLNMIKNRIIGYINSDQAEEPTLNTIEDYYSSNQNIVFLQLLADLYIRTNNGSKALEASIIIEDETSGNGSVLFAFAQQAVLNRNYKIASEAYREIIENYPSSALYSQAEIGYTRSLEQAVNNFSNYDTWKPLLINERIDSVQFNDLISAYSALYSKYPNNEIGWEAELRMGRIFQYKLKKYEKADSIYQKILDESRSLQFIEEAKLGVAEIALLRGNIDKTEDYLAAIVEGKRADNNLRSQSTFLLAKCKMWKGKFEESLKYFNRIIENPQNEYANNALEYTLIINTFKNDSLNLFSFVNSDYLIEKNKFAEALSGFKKLADNSNLFILKDIASLKYAELLIAMDNYENAAIFLEKLSNCDENNIYKDRFLYLLGLNYYFGLNDKNKSLDPLNKILIDYQDSIYSNKARKLISQINPRVGNNL